MTVETRTEVSTMCFRMGEIKVTKTFKCLMSPRGDGVLSEELVAVECEADGDWVTHEIQQELAGWMLNKFGPKPERTFKIRANSQDYLAACPCCGGKAEIDEDEFGVMVRCTDCGLNNGGEYAPRIDGTDEEAIEKWNKRITRVFENG